MYWLHLLGIQVIGRSLKLCPYISTSWTYTEVLGHIQKRIAHRVTLVNGFYPNGTSCPLPTYHAYTCAPLCVRDIASCPESIRPTCPEGQSYCVDGSCRSSCPSDLKSKCSCPGAPEITVPIYACKEGSRADIHNFVASNKSAQRAEACAIEIGVPTSVSNWDGANPPDMMWGECPTPDYGELNFHEPVFIALYVFYGSCVAMFVLWTLYKRLREKVVSKS